MIEIEREIEHLGIAIEMALRGARPHVILALTSLKHDRVVTICERATGEKPKQGRVPDQLEAFMRGRAATLACSFFARKYLALIERGVDQANSLIIAYDLTSEEFLAQDDKPYLSFDRAWNVVRALKFHKSHEMTTCKICRSKYIVLATKLKIDEKHCPVCPLLKDKEPIKLENDNTQGSLPFNPGA